MKDDKDDLELETNDAWSDENISARMQMQGRIGSGKNRLLGFSLAIVLVFIFVAGLLYFFTYRSSAGESNLQSKVTALDQKVVELERQVAELQGKIGTSGADPALLQRMDALGQKVDALEKQKRSTVEPRAKLSPPSKPAAPAEKQYHKVRKGETLLQISKQYGISMAELRKLNNLSEGHPVHTGQKLVVSRN